MSVFQAFFLFVAVFGSIGWLGAAIAWWIARVCARLDDAQEHRRNLARYGRFGGNRYRV